MVINMELVFLNKEDLSVLDYGYVEKDYQIVIDSVIPQKSTFNVNKTNINAEVGDLLIIKHSTINYIGIILSIQIDEEKGISKVQTNDFISILDLKVKLKSFSGNLSYYLYTLISDAYLLNNDMNQRIKYLSIARDYQTITGSLTYEKDTIDSISNVLKTLNKAYSIALTYKLVYFYGTITGIELRISTCTSGLVLKSNFKGITNLLVSTSGEQSVNKVIFVPSDDNVSYKSTECYYLLTDGTITNLKDSIGRYKNVKSVTKIYKDSDFASLKTTAQTEMFISSLEHSITFDIRMDNKVAVPFKDFNVGDFIEFITPTKTYQTMVTQISLKNNDYQASVTLGEYRVSLTDKIKLLTKRQ